MPKPAARLDRRILTVIAIPLAIAAAALVHPPIVVAGTFTVHTCQTPTGTWTGAGGWTSTASVPVAGYDHGSSTRCSSPGSGASLEFGGSGLPVGAASWVSWDFAAPAGTAIGSFEIHRAFSLAWPTVANVANRPYVQEIWHDGDVSAGLIDFKQPLQAGQVLLQALPSEVAGDRVSWRSLHLRLSCWGLFGSLDCGPYPAQVLISRAAIGLTDTEAPAGFATGGALAGSESVRGVAGLSLRAADAGGGVYRVALAVDGDEVSRHVIDDAGGSCADVEPANDDPYEFGTSQPCRLHVDGSVQLDTATLRDGPHVVRATVEDAGGNTAVVFDGTVQMHNAPINSGAPMLSGQASVGAQLAASPGQWDGAPTGYDHRWLRCDADGAACRPVAGATGAAYALTAADAYHRVRVEVTAANGSGAATALSAPSALVADADGRTAPPSRQGGGGAAGTPDPAPGAGGGIQGIANPLGQLPGHVANGSDASAHARIAVAFQRPDGGTGRRISTPYGRRGTIVGRLTDASGAGIGGAQIGAAWRIDGRGWVARPGVRTGADGRFVYVLPSGPSRDVRFTYFAYSDSRAIELSNVVHVDVRAPLTIRADRRRVSGARVVRLSGHVGGGSIPRTGLLVTLEGFQRGWGWRAFRTVRTDRHGRWSTRYRFRLTAGRFGFRALVPHQGAFPFATSRSAGVFVLVS
jgi:hypothetical protein